MSDSNFLPESDFRNNVDDDPSDETDDTTEYQLPKRRNEACQKRKKQR